ncbi:MAG: LysR family transcriptional regulator [Tissierellales bacterium]|nr:LysR family transcriptional regulator [Tissierellales bacterium]
MINQKLKTFYELTRFKNMTKTAKYLNMTQPGVSKQIKQLELYYGIKVFRKNGRNLEITAAGKLLRDEVEKLIVCEKNIKQSLEIFSKPVKNQYIGATKTIGSFLAPELMENYSRFENDRLLLTVDNTKHILNKLDNGDIDLALVEGIIDLDKYDWRVLREDELICITSYSDARKTINIDDMKQKVLILREEGSGTRNIIERALKNIGVSIDDFRATMEIGDWSAIKSLVSRGMGISFLSRIAVVKELENGELIEQKIEDFNLKRNLYYVWRKNEECEFAEKFLKHNYKLYKHN